jgi:4-amino-4-deoxy-L-arabinose transferase-like glycosyltransferase
VIRISVAVSDIPLLGDAKTRYDPIAKSLLQGNGFSRDTAPPYRPDNFDQPGYPLMVASIYAATDRNRRSVVLFQLLLEMIILLTVWGIARALKLPRAAQRLAVGIGLICPFVAKYAGLILSEVPATLVICLTCYTFIRAVQKPSANKYVWWALAGVLSGISLLVRADLVIVVGLMWAVAIVLPRSLTATVRLKQIGLLAIALVLTLAPWTARNYLRFERFIPLGTLSNQSRLPYVRWMNTWFDDPADLKTFWWDALTDGPPPSFPADKIPDSDQRIRASNALIEARAQKTLGGDSAQQFQDLATQAARERPIHTFVVVPLKRVIKTWLYPQVNRVPTLMGTRLPFFSIQGLWIVMSVLTIVGVIDALRLKQYSVLLLVAVIVGRVALPLISSLGADPRLLVESIPAIYVLSAMGAFAAYEFVRARSSRVRRRRSERASN